MVFLNDEVATADCDCDPNALDELLDKETFKARRAQILPHIRDKSDSGPVTLHFGAERGSVAQTLKRALDAGPPGSRIVRGFRLLHVPMDRDGSSFMWKACFEPVVAHPQPHVVRAVRAETSVLGCEGGAPRVRLRLRPQPQPCASGRECYVSVRAALRPEWQDSQYIFVPSSRAHRELSDEQLLRGEHIFCTLMGGVDVNIDSILRNYKRLGRLNCVVGRTPEECPAVARVCISYFPFFLDWLHYHWSTHDAPTVAEMMGFPLQPRSGDAMLDADQCFHLGTQPSHIDDSLLFLDPEDVAEMFTHPETMHIVDPTPTYALHKHWLLHREESVAVLVRDRALWFQHYREQMLKIEARLCYQNANTPAPLGEYASLNPVA